MNIVTKAEAIEKGRKTYFTGVPCKHGHISERYVSSGACVECQKVSNAHRLQKFPNAEERESYAEASYKYRRQRAAAVKEAIAEGQTVFWVGRPCKHGHTSGYRVSNLKCVDCDRQDARDAKRRSRASKKAEGSKTSKPSMHPLAPGSTILSPVPLGPNDLIGYKVYAGSAPLDTPKPKTLNLRQRLVAFIGKIVHKAKTFTRA